MSKDPFYKFKYHYEWGSTLLYHSLMKEHLKDKPRSEFDIEFNGWFYEFDSDMGELIRCFLIDKMINQHVFKND